jgi:hypothetical protein
LAHFNSRLSSKAAVERHPQSLAQTEASSQPQLQGLGTEMFEHFGLPFVKPSILPRSRYGGKLWSANPAAIAGIRWWYSRAPTAHSECSHRPAEVATAHREVRHRLMHLAVLAWKNSTSYAPCGGSDSGRGRCDARLQVPPERDLIHGLLPRGSIFALESRGSAWGLQTPRSWASNRAKEDPLASPRRPSFSAVSTPLRDSPGAAAMGFELWFGRRPVRKAYDFFLFFSR